MKTTFRFVSVLFMIFFVTIINAQQPSLQVVTSLDLKPVKRTLHPVAKKAMQRGEKPGAFKNVKIKLSPNVVVLKKPEVLEIKQNLHQGIIQPKKLKKAKLQEHKIYIDPDSKMVFKPVKFAGDTMVLQRPPLKAVLSEFKIPQQKVAFNLANTAYVLDGTEVADEKTPTGDYLMKLEFKDSVYQIKKEIKTKHGKTTINATLVLKGHLYLTNPAVQARYSPNDGYSVVVLMDEQADISASFKSDFTSELSFPLWAFDIPAGDYGSCKVGIYAFIDMNGKMNLTYKIEQSLQVKAGLKGKTFAYYPRSYKPVIDIKKQLKTDYTIEAELKAFGGVEVIADITVLKYDLATVTTKAGPELEIKSVDNGRNFEAKAGGRFVIKAKLIKIDKTFTLLDKYYLLWEYIKKNYGGYILTVKSADAYHDRVWGVIQKVKDNDTVPYTGKLQLRVLHTDQSHQDYKNITTDKDGIFAVTGVALVKGDKVKIKVKNSPNWSLPIAADIPFNEIRLHYADYYTNTVQGSIASKIDLFPAKKQASVTQAPGNIPKGFNQVQGVKSNVLSQIKPSININPDLFKNAITYKGDIEVLVRSDVHHAKLNLSSVNLGQKKSRYKRHRGRKIDKKLISPSLALKKQVVNLPFGAFVVKNVDIKPRDLVKVRINIDGFILESNEVLADGLVFSPSVDKNLKGSIKTKEIKADDSYVVINALRSDKTPTGKVHLIKGIDMKHTTPPKSFPNQKFTYPKLKEFRQAVHPLVFYDKTVNLQPASQKGFAIAHTGPWKVTNIYYDLKKVTRIQKFDGHRFEYIGYKYDNRWVVYKYYQKTCTMDKDFLSKINKPGVFVNPGRFKQIGH